MSALPKDIVTRSIEDVWDRADEVLDRAFTAKEREVFSALSIDKRRRDWLAGRLAAKRAIQLRFGIPLPRIEIRRTLDGPERGRPIAFLDGSQVLNGYVSITHSGSLAAACYSSRAVGLDIEVCEERDGSFVDTAFDPRELAAIPRTAELSWAELIARAWCRKEAFAKSLGRGFALPLRAIRPDLQPGLSIEDGLFDHDRRMAWARVRRVG